MSTTDIIETSDALGEPIELYRFSYGPGFGTVITYTDADFEVSHDNLIWTPAVGIERDAITASQSLDKAELEVSIAEDAEIAELFRDYPPSDVVGLSIFRCHWDADAGAITTPMAVWVGRVLSCRRDGYVATLRGEPAVTSLRRVGLRRHFQYMCSHVLYGSACGANRVDHTTATTILSSDLRTVTVSGHVSDQHKGGLLSWQPLGLPVERRTVLQISRQTDAGGAPFSVLTLAGSPRNIQDNMAGELAKGCRHTIADCRTVFANAPNFGGMPYIPVENPHGSTKIYN